MRGVKGAHQESARFELVRPRGRDPHRPSRRRRTVTRTCPSPASGPFQASHSRDAPTTSAHHQLVHRSRPVRHQPGRGERAPVVRVRPALLPRRKGPAGGCVVLEELTAPLPRLRLTRGQTFAFSPIIGLRGPTAVHVEWEPTDARVTGRTSRHDPVCPVQARSPPRRTAQVSRSSGTKRSATAQRRDERPCSWW